MQYRIINECEISFMTAAISHAVHENSPDDGWSQVEICRK
jgi:hypothetical protein